MMWRATSSISKTTSSSSSFLFPFLLRNSNFRHFSVLKDVSTDLLVSTSMGHLVGGKTHLELINSLVGMNLVKNKDVERSMRKVDRQHFVPEETSIESMYSNNPISIGHSATISTPQQHAQVLDLLSSHLQNGMSAVDIGCGSGYLTAVFSDMVGHEGKVVGIDIVPQLIEFSKKNIEKCGLSTQNNITLLTENGNHDVLGDQQYDCIHIAVAVEEKNELMSYMKHIKPGGGLLAPVGSKQNEKTLYYMCKGKDGISMEEKIIMKVLCQSMMTSLLDDSSKPSETHQQKVDRLKNQLMDWKSQFTLRHQRSPTRQDIFQDQEIYPLFQEFAKYRK